MTQTFIVSADHISPEYRADRLPVRVSPWKNPNAAETFSAYAAGYGSGKTYATPESAIRGLLAENGCTNIRIHAEPETVAAEAPAKPARKPAKPAGSGVVWAKDESGVYRATVHGRAVWAWAREPGDWAIGTRGSRPAADYHDSANVHDTPATMGANRVHSAKRLAERLAATLPADARPARRMLAGQMQTVWDIREDESGELVVSCMGRSGPMVAREHGGSVVTADSAPADSGDRPDADADSAILARLDSELAGPEGSADPATDSALAAWLARVDSLLAGTGHAPLAGGEREAYPAEGLSLDSAACYADFVRGQRGPNRPATDAEKAALRLFEWRAVPGLYTYEHFERADGAFYQTAHSRPWRAVYQRTDGGRVECHTKPELWAALLADPMAEPETAAADMLGKYRAAYPEVPAGWREIEAGAETGQGRAGQAELPDAWTLGTAPGFVNREPGRDHLLVVLVKDAKDSPHTVFDMYEAANVSSLARFTNESGYAVGSTVADRATVSRLEYYPATAPAAPVAAPEPVPAPVAEPAGHVVTVYARAAGCSAEMVAQHVADTKAGAYAMARAAGHTLGARIGGREVCRRAYRFNRA